MELRCRCGEVVGRVENASPQKVNRVVCYCDDCQAFAHQLGRADLLNAQGGTDIIQVAPAALTFLKGQQHIAGLRLSPKGLFRFHTTCCNTPVGNTLSPAIPFVGIVAQVFDDNPKTVDGVFGPPIGAILGKYAIGKPPADSTGINLPRAAARDHQGTRLAPARAGVAESLLPAENARAGLSADGAGAGAARGAAAAMRPEAGAM